MQARVREHIVTFPVPQIKEDGVDAGRCAVHTNGAFFDTEEQIVGVLVRDKFLSK